jgi:hypothetical protein
MSTSISFSRKRSTLALRYVLNNQPRTLILTEWTTEQPSHLAKRKSNRTGRHKKWDRLESERGKDLPIKFPVAFERALQTANLVNREPAGIAHFC